MHEGSAPVASPSTAPRPSAGATTVWTIGHSTRSWEEFLAILAAQDIGAIGDVRRFPGSRRYPWFASEAMAAQLPLDGLDYLWLPELGGRRRCGERDKDGSHEGRCGCCCC